MTGLSFADVMQLAIIGLAQGSLYSLIAIGLVLIYKATEQINFAQGEFMMLGAFFGFQFIVLSGMPFWLGFLLAIAVLGAIGYTYDALVIRRLTGQPVFVIFILTLATGIVLRALAGMYWGFDSFSLPSMMPGTIDLSGVIIGWDHVIAILAAALLSLALFLFFRFL